MSSFFTLPASQRKRKREDASDIPSARKRGARTKADSKPQKPTPARTSRDESISSGSEDELERRGAGDEEGGSESESDDEHETNAEKRLRLASNYLESIKDEVDEAGYDAEDIDRDLIAERLQEDVAEEKGRLYRRIASTYSFSSATQTQFRSDSLSTTSIATCPPYAYTVSKDMTLTKWELPAPPSPSNPQKPPKKPPRPIRRRPTKLISTKGNKNSSSDRAYQHHTSPILAVAASDTGKFVATGGADNRLIIWSASDLKPLRVFTQHRDSVTSLAFRRGTNQLYSSSKDRTIKTWSLDELAYVETLFGHQDEVVDVAGLAQEKCVSVGARDRTVRMWKVAEETQLVFRGGGGSSEKKTKPQSGSTNEDSTSISKKQKYSEGSIDRIALIDESIFVTGSDNGSLSLWDVHKKKPVSVTLLAHGLDPPLLPEEASAETVPDPKKEVPDPQPRWITALAAVPYSDLLLSGSWDGVVRVWRISDDKRRLERVGILGGDGSGGGGGGGENAVFDEHEGRGAEAKDGISVRGVINDLSVFERGDRGQDGLCVVAAVGSEHRLGRWLGRWKKDLKAKNGAVVFEVPKISVSRRKEKDDDYDGGEGDGEGAGDQGNGDPEGAVGG